MKVLDLDGLVKYTDQIKSRFVGKSTLETDVKGIVNVEYVSSLVGDTNISYLTNAEFLELLNG